MIIYHHLGLGDHFICNGIVNYIYNTYKKHKYSLICKQKNFDTIKSLYSHLPDLKIIPIPGYNELFEIYSYVKQYQQPMIRIGFENLTSEINFDQQFYRQINLDFKYRYALAHIPNSTKNSHKLYLNLTSDNKEYILVHNTCSYGKIDIAIDSHLPVIYVSEITSNLLDWIEIIEKAKEIHVVPSSLFCLIDSIDMSRTTNKLFYHNNRKNTIININHKENNHKWSIINYAQQL